MKEKPAFPKPVRKFLPPSDYKTKLYFEEMLRDHAEKPLEPEQMRVWARRIAGIAKERTDFCANPHCGRRLTARERLRTCKFCGYKGNWKAYEAELYVKREIRKKVEKHDKPEFGPNDPRRFRGAW